MASIFDKPIFDSAGERRRLRIINTLFLALSRCGYRVFISDENARELGVCIGDLRVNFTVEAVPARRRADQEKTTMRAKVPLQISITWRKPNEDAVGVWRDGKQRIEDQLQEIVVSL